MHLGSLEEKSRSELKGALLILASTACIAVTFVASKQAMRELSPLGFTPIWFAIASLWGLGFYQLRNRPKPSWNLSGSVGAVLLLGLLNGTHNLLFFSAINLGDPTLVSFFSRSETVYSVLLGALVLGERMRGYQWLGVVITVIGAGLMTFRAGMIVWLMLVLLLISNFFLSLSTLIAKKYVAIVDPLILSVARTVVMSSMLGMIGLMVGQLSWPGLTTWFWIIGGAFFGPFLSYLLFYQGLVYFDMARGAVIRGATQPFFVAIYSLILFGTLITLQQFAGGVLMIIGVGFMLWKRY